jgi:hypothetical protein
MTLIPQEDKDAREARTRARRLHEQGSALHAIARSVKTSVMSVLPWRGDEDEDENEDEHGHERDKRNPLASARDRGRRAAALEPGGMTAVRPSKMSARTPMAR